MKKYVSAALLTAVVNICHIQAAQQSGFDVERLSARGRAAYQKLLSASLFRVGGVGYGGQTSEEELALHLLLEEKESVEALKSLVRGGSLEGGLYGLLGLSITDAGAFNRAVDEYNSRGESPGRRRVYPYDLMNVPEGQVAIQSGCIVSTEYRPKVVRDIQSGRYDRLLRRGRRG